MVDYINPNREHLRSLPSEEVDWAAFHRSQEPHRQAFDSMIKEYRHVYDNPQLSSKEREEAGYALGYSQIRIDFHELIGVLMGRFKVLRRLSLLDRA